MNDDDMHHTDNDNDNDTGTHTDRSTQVAPERRDLLDALGHHRQLLRQTAAGLTEEQARECSTVSDLSVGGIIKHVAHTEADWADFMVNGAPASDVDWSNPDEATIAAYHAQFRLTDDETLAGVLAEYERVAAATDRLVVEIDLDRSFPLPPAPWFAPGAERSARRTIAHVIAETAQHAGHADIIREAIDGAKSMG